MISKYDIEISQSILWCEFYEKILKRMKTKFSDFVHAIMDQVTVIVQKVSNTNTKSYLVMPKTLAWFIVSFIHSLQE